MQQGWSLSAQSELPSSSDFSSQTFVVSFQVMPALSHACLVRGWIKVSANSDLDIGWATGGSGRSSEA